MDDSSFSAEYRTYLAAIVGFHLAAADAVGLGASDYQALNVLDLDGPLSAGELALRLGLTSGATTRLLERLETAGVARRVVSAQDRRRLVIESTGVLPERLDEILAMVRPPVGDVLQGLDPEQLDGVRRYFRGAADAYRQAARRLSQEPESS